MSRYWIIEVTVGISNKKIDQVSEKSIVGRWLCGTIRTHVPRIEGDQRSRKVHSVRHDERKNDVSESGIVDDLIQRDTAIGIE